MIGCYINKKTLVKSVKILVFYKITLCAILQLSQSDISSNHKSDRTNKDFSVWFNLILQHFKSYS